VVLRLEGANRVLHVPLPRCPARADGRPCLPTAVRCGNLEVVLWLIRRKVSLKAKDAKGNLPIDTAAAAITDARRATRGAQNGCCRRAVANPCSLLRSCCSGRDRNDLGYLPKQRPEFTPDEVDELDLRLQTAEHIERAILAAGGCNLPQRHVVPKLEWAGLLLTLPFIIAYSTVGMLALLFSRGEAFQECLLRLPDIRRQRLIVCLVLLVALVSGSSVGLHHSVHISLLSSLAIVTMAMLTQAVATCRILTEAKYAAATTPTTVALLQSRRRRYSLTRLARTCLWLVLLRARASPIM
jgi:hypothetical protein